MGSNPLEAIEDNIAELGALLNGNAYSKEVSLNEAEISQLVEAT